MTDRQRSPVAAAILVLGVTAVLGLLLSWARLPSAVLFASLLGGMAHALTSPTELRVPPVAFRLGQAMVGVTIGSLVSVTALTVWVGPCCRSPRSPSARCCSACWPAGCWPCGETSPS